MSIHQRLSNYIISHTSDTETGKDRYALRSYFKHVSGTKRASIIKPI